VKCLAEQGQLRTRQPLARQELFEMRHDLHRFRLREERGVGGVDRDSEVSRVGEG
jgi:hypothetical protein